LLVEQEILQTAAIELKGSHRREGGGPELEPFVDAAVVAGGIEIAQPELVELSVAKVRGETEPRVEVMRGDFDARFADLECRFRRRMRALLGHEHAQLRRLAP